MSALLIKSTLGTIRLRFLPEKSPETVSHIKKLAENKLFNNAGVMWYRSDFVIQTGLHGTGVSNPFPDLAINESSRSISNTRGTVAVAHHDVPDNGNSEFFVNLGVNTHLDEAYGGYCVFALVEEGDEESWGVVDAVAKSVAGGTLVDIEEVRVV